MRRFGSTFLLRGASQAARRAARAVAVGAVLLGSASSSPASSGLASPGRASSGMASSGFAPSVLASSGIAAPSLAALHRASPGAASASAGSSSATPPALPSPTQAAVGAVPQGTPPRAETPKEASKDDDAPAPFVERGVPSTGRADPRLTSFDAMMRDFVRERGVPGATLAISRDGRLVYARGFGYADLEAREPMQPDARMRIASLSKPITSAAILQLAQAGALALDDPVLQHIDPTLFTGRVPVDPRWADVTIAQLLEHTAGFDRKRSGDPMFLSPRIARDLGVDPPASARDVVTWMLRRPLDFDPGLRFEYSNFGYDLLGRVIERLTELPYEAAVRERLLAPLGVAGMRVGGTTRAERLPGEVVYHDARTEPGVLGALVGRRVPAPYGSWSQEALDAHGGWVASAPDLLRFARLHDLEGEEALLEPAWIARSFAEPATREPRKAKNVWYGAGWQVRRLREGVFHAWHTGSLPGTATLLVRRADGLSWAVLFNALADAEGDYLATAIDPLVHEAAALVLEWPEFDLFDEPAAPR